MEPLILDLDIDTPRRATTTSAPPVAPIVELSLDEDLAATPAPAVNREAVPTVLRMAAHLQDEGHHREAEPILRGVLAADPDHVEALHRLGVAQLALGHRERAIALLVRATRVETGDHSLWRHLGEALRETRRLEEAEACFRYALELAPNDADALYNLAHVHVQQGRLEDAARRYHETLTHAPDDADVLTALGTVLAHLERRRDALMCLERAHRIDPGNATARHFIAALRREPVTSAPADYVAELFDNYAETFDEQLVHKLGYDAPKLLRRAVDEIAGSVENAWRIADLGCGTGLCGEAFRSMATTLIGVDLSPGMIQRARRRNLYDVLLCGDVAEALAPEAGSLDLVLAGDVLPYVGSVEALFELAAAALRAGGLMAFTTERGSGDDVVLRPSGRFAHAESYIRRVAAASGLAVDRLEEIMARRDRGRWIPGHLYVLRRAR
ncbi:MAG: tetratricopeptide repeat protein [Planctomycetota bacterium]|jgi:predicted TPR repeat methyltransferase